MEKSSLKLTEKGQFVIKDLNSRLWKHFKSSVVKKLQTLPNFLRCYVQTINKN